MTTIYIIRHGECRSNFENRFVGFSDWELTDKGREQARLLGEYMESIHIDAVYASDLKRAYETVEPFANAKGLDVIKKPGLREINGGDWEEVKFAEIPRDEFISWGIDFKNCKCKGGESVMEMADRVNRTIQEIAEENDGKSVAVGTHATPVRTFLFSINNSWSNDESVGWVPNASVTKVEYENGKFTLVQSGYDKFLKGLSTSLNFK